MDRQVIQDCHAELEELRVQSHGTPNISRRIGGVMNKLQELLDEPKCALVEMPEPNASKINLPEPESFVANPALVAEPVEDKKGKKK